MAKRMTKKQIALFARIHIAVHSSYFDMFGTEELDVTDEDKDRLVEAVRDLAYKIAKGQPMNFGRNKEIVEYVRKNY